MSIIALEISENKIKIAAYGRRLSGDEILCENFKKIRKISDSLIIGVTGLADSANIFEVFVNENKETFEALNSETHGIKLMNDFKLFLKDYGYEEETIKKELGGFLVANKYFLCVFYYDNTSGYPYTSLSSVTHKKGAFGSTRDYTAALIDANFPLDDAIKISSKKFTSINDNITMLEIDK
jgi:ATP-dependent protease HslVU (ClpYQ) peptidase subunit